MDRGVIVGGGLIAASFLVAMLLNRSAHEDAPPAPVPPPPARICDTAPLAAAETPREPGVAETECEPPTAVTTAGSGVPVAAPATNP
jgi:hypothetical protein